MDQELKNQKYLLERRIIGLMVRILFIFGVPAAIAVLLGHELDTRFGLDSAATGVCLAIAFVSSWVITIVLYQRIERERRAIEKAIEENEQT